MERSGKRSVKNRGDRASLSCRERLAGEIVDENLRQQEMRRLWADRLFTCHTLSVVQVGSEEHSSRQRSYRSSKAGASFAGGPLTGGKATSRYLHSTNPGAVG